MPGDQYIDFGYQGQIEDSRVEALREGSAVWELQTTIPRESPWISYRDEIRTPAGSELPAGTLCRESVLFEGQWSDPSKTTPCQTTVTPVPEPGLALTLIIGALVLQILRKYR